MMDTGLGVQTYFKSKFERIMQLKDWGFNIPRMAYYPMDASGFLKAKNLQKFLDSNKHVELFNVRTYTWNSVSKQEGWSSKHHVGVERGNVASLLKSIITTCHCMVDAEVPGDGVYAGNIAIEDDDYCILEWCHKEGAMVRQADHSASGFADELCESFSIDHPSLSEIINASLEVPWRNVVLEWAVFKKPCGILGRNDIWWEWRNWLPVERT